MLATASVALLATSIVSTGKGGLAAIGAAMADPLSVFDSRSPGVRDAGALTQTKPRRHHAGVVPTERVKSQVRTHPDEPGIGGDLPGMKSPFGDGFPPVDRNFGSNSGPLGASGPYPGDSGAFPGSNFFPAQLPGTTTPTVEEAVPEPSTWLTMILGVFVVGASARRRRAASLTHAQNP